MDSLFRRPGGAFAGVLLSAVALAAQPAAPVAAWDAGRRSPPGTRLAAPLLRDGDRVVFLGDSITAGAIYTRYVEAFLRLRHPGWSLTFINAGIGGHTAVEGLARIDQDVLRYAPTVVFVNFGMNDAGFAPDSRPGAYEANMRSLLDQLAAAKVSRVVWLEPTPFDVRGLTASQAEASREAAIVRYVDFAREEGARRKVPVVPVHDALEEAIRSDGRQDRPGRLLPDRVHPSRAGHAIIAATLLDFIGESLSPPTLEGSWADGTLRLKGAPRARSVPWDGRGPIALDLAGLPAPVPMLLGDPPAGSAAGAQARQLGRLLVRWAGLPPERRYAFSSFGEPLGAYTGAELARGVDLLAAMPASKARAGEAACAADTGLAFHNDYECVMALIAGRDQVSGATRSDRLRALPDQVPGRKEAYQQLFGAWYDEYAKYLSRRMQETLAMPHLVQVTPTSEGSEKAR